MLENIKSIIYIVYASLMVIITLFNYFLGKSKIKKEKGKSEEVKDELSQTNSLVEGLKASSEILGDFLIQAMENAEESGMTGLAKKAYVIAQVIGKCAELNVDYNEIKELVSSKIETLITFSKEVNKRLEMKGEENGEIKQCEEHPERFI